MQSSDKRHVRNRVADLLDVRRAVRIACLTGSAAAAMFAGNATYAAASEDTGDETALQEVIVTGSHLRRTESETAAPVQVLTAEEIHESGYTSTQQVLSDLTANGQGTLSQSFSGAFASGAAGIALRGLNVGDTLVLIDGHRSAPYPIGDDGYRSFVDVANLPFDAIERIEVLKEGASAIYGSDAIGGVVNIILKKSYEGAQVTADGGISGHGDGASYHASGIWGLGDLASDGHNVYFSAEFRKQDPILYDQRGGTFENRNYAGQGGINATYGVPSALNGGLAGSKTGYVTDPTGAIVGFMKGCTAASYAAGGCGYQDTWDQIQPPTENINLLGRFTQNIATDWQWDFEGGYFESKSEQANRPDGPAQYAGGYQGIAFGPGLGPTLLAPVPPITIPATNPSYPAGTGLASALLRYNFVGLGPTLTETDAHTYRAVFDLNGKAGGWNLEASAGYTEVVLNETGLNYISETNLQSALNSTTDPYLVGQPNSGALDSFIAPTLMTTQTSKLAFGHAGASRDLFQLPGGPLGLAFGGDWYVRDQYGVAPPQVQSGIQAVGDFSNNFTIGVQQVESGYAEIDAPIVKQFDAGAAIRYDHYNLSGGRASPQVTFKFTPIEQIAFRGTASEGFVAPGPGENGRAGQSFFAGTIADPVLCPTPATLTAPGNFAGQCLVQLPGLQQSNAALKPETSKQWTLGVVLEPIRDISATFDWYSIVINNEIVPGSAAGVGAGSIVRGTNFAPIPEYQPGGGTVLTVPPVAPIAYYGISYVNANTTRTSGFDLALQGQHKFDFGTISSKATLTYIEKWDLVLNGQTYSLAGTHGPYFYSGDTGNPRSRIQWATTFSRPSWEVTGTMNYIDSFEDIDPSATLFGLAPQGTCLQALTNSGGFAGTVFANQLGNGVIPPQVGCTVGHFITFDLQGRYDLTKHLEIHASAINLFNAKAPLDYVTYGGALGAVPWNPSLHLQGAIGQYFNLGATYRW
jgi:iron complex outermembrane receptor protein